SRTCSRSPIRRSSWLPGPTSHRSSPGLPTMRWRKSACAMRTISPPSLPRVPMNNIDAAIAEADRAVASLGARGVQIFTHVAGQPLSRAEFRPFFRRMVEHDLPSWVHPMRGHDYADYKSEQQSQDEVWFAFGWPYETTA